MRSNKRSPTGEFRYQWFSRHGQKANEALRSKGRYFMSHQEDLIEIQYPDELEQIPTEVNENDQKGFALAAAKEFVRFDPDQIQFVRRCFDEGQVTGSKMKFEQIVQNMKEYRIDGALVFPPKKVLSVQQTKSLCSRYFFLILYFP